MGRELFVQDGADGVDDLEVGAFVAASDVVGLSGSAFVIGQVDAPAVVEDVEPVADVSAVAVDGDGIARRGVADDGGDELLVVLLGAIIVRTVGDDGVEPVGVAVAAHQHIAGGLGGGVGAVGGVGGLLGEEGVGIVAQCSIHFISGNVVKTRVLVDG